MNDYRGFQRNYMIFITGVMVSNIFLLRKRDGLEKRGFSIKIGQKLYYILVAVKTTGNGWGIFYESIII